MQKQTFANNLHWCWLNIVVYKKYVSNFNTLTYFRLKCFKIMTSKSGFLWKLCFVAMQSDNITFYAYKMIKGTSGFNLKKTIFFNRWRQHQKTSWNIFQIQKTPLLWLAQDPQGCLEKQSHPMSLNLVVWCAKIGSKAKKLWKSVKKPSLFWRFSCHFWSFLNFLCFGPNFSAPN